MRLNEDRDRIELVHHLIYVLEFFSCLVFIFSVFSRSSSIWPAMKDFPQPLQESTTNVPSTQPSLPTSPHVERKLGDNEISYFLPSRESGVNDMYVCHLGMGWKVPNYWTPSQVSTSRISCPEPSSWAESCIASLGNYAPKTPTARVQGKDEWLWRRSIPVSIP